MTPPDAIRIADLAAPELTPLQRGVIEAAPLFDDANLGASRNPKVKIVQSDAYRALLRSEGHFDVIASEPSNPWVTGVEMLYSKEFLEESTISELLDKYCKFLPIEIAFGKEKEWKDGKEVKTKKDNIINDTKPLWTQTPSELKDEDYSGFYKRLYPVSEEPLFNIHLNVDYPFTLTGILYFPRIKNNIEIQKNKIQYGHTPKKESTQLH